MSPSTKRVVAGIVLTLIPILTVNLTKKSAWGQFIATPPERVEGDPNAPILMVEYSDFQCPMCARVMPALKTFLDVYKGKVKLAYKYFPLKQHAHAMEAAHAAQCAAEQQKFWPYQQELFEKQFMWAPLASATTWFTQIAQDTQLNMNQYNACVNDPSREQIIERDRAEGQDRQISATPTLFIGDQRLVGTFIETDGARVIEQKLRNR